jgi:hypothetical protein
MSIRRTDPANFRVVDKQTNHLWLKLLENRGAGMRVAIRVDHEEHDDNIEQELSDADIGERFGLVLADNGEPRAESYVDRIADSADEISKRTSASAD